jgi:5-methylcytosine-specific restriction protein A
LGKSLLLFRNTATGLRFEGEMVYKGHHIERAPDRNGAERDAIVFELRALEAITEATEAAGPPSGVTLEELRQLALAAAAGLSQMPTQATSIKEAWMSGTTC